MSIRFFVVGIILLIFFASQFYWLRVAWKLLRRRITRASRRRAVASVALLGFAFLFVYNLGFLGRTSPTHMTLRVALLEVPFKLWFFGSLAGFLLVFPLWVLDRTIRMIRRRGRSITEGRTPAASNSAPVSPSLPSPPRRRFLEQTAMAVGAIPFAAGAYGLLYERLDLETTERRIKLQRLPRAFHGFRIAQLSDIHIGPFMSEAEIRRIVGVTNSLKPDLMVLTGDFVTWDPLTQVPVVRTLSRLKAPFGVYGCLGNHEAWSKTEDSIAQLFAGEGVRILRQERVPISSHNKDNHSSAAAALNLIGVDFQTRTRIGRTPRPEHFVRRYLEGVEKLVAPDTVNILLSHNPNTFDRAAELGIDLSLAGHTHGGQVSLEFVNQNISPSRLITSYVRGWFRKGSAQLYVNRGIGTIGIPIRLGAAPEISVFELVRET
jgi:predicted MPP superfamily phosphohydrolase